MISHAGDLARRLARDAEAVCRHYLSKGRRSGRYWIVGDVQNTPGRSLYVRLAGPDYGPGAAGHWHDAATREYGDLLDLIRLNRDLPRLTEAMDEARLFLSLPRPVDPIAGASEPRIASSPDPPRLPAACFMPAARCPARRPRPICAPAASPQALDWPALRFHPSVYYRADETPNSSCGRRCSPPSPRWTAPSAAFSAPGSTATGPPRRHCPIRAARIGCLLGNGVRFGKAADIVAAGEGIETMLALKSVLPDLPMIAGLSANHLAALDLPSSLRRLYVARDNDAAGLQGGRTAARTPSRHRRPRTRAGACRLQPRSLPPWPRRSARAAH